MTYKYPEIKKKERISFRNSGKGDPVYVPGGYVGCF